MTEGYRHKYDPIADALYIYVRAGKARLQREYTDDIILDLDDAGQLIGIELLNPAEADLRDVVREYALDPHLLDVLGKLRHLMPEARRELTVA